MMKYTCWVKDGYNWSPNDYETLEEALKHESYGAAKRITKDVNYDVVERTDR